MFSLSGLQLGQNRIIEGNAGHMLLSMSYSRTYQGAGKTKPIILKKLIFKKPSVWLWNIHKCL